MGLAWVNNNAAVLRFVHCSKYVSYDGTTLNSVRLSLVLILLIPNRTRCPVLSIPHSVPVYLALLHFAFLYTLRPLRSPPPLHSLNPNHGLAPRHSERAKESRAKTKMPGMAPIAKTFFIAKKSLFPCS